MSGSNGRTAALKVVREERQAAEVTPDAGSTHGLVLTALLRSGVSMRPSEVAQYSGLEVGEVEVALRVLEGEGVVRATTWKVEL